MPRLGKKTLYLDLDALDQLETALKRLPGRPSVSSFLSEQLPVMAHNLNQMVEALEAGGLRGMAQMLGVASDLEKSLDQIKEDVKKAADTSENPDMPLSQMIEAVPPKKPRKPRAKKVDKA